MGERFLNDYVLNLEKGGKKESVFEGTSERV